METLYRIEELYTTGWETIDAKYTKLTKEQTKQKLEILLSEGYSPDIIRAVPDHV